jgi:hypothetical protein
VTAVLVGQIPQVLTGDGEDVEHGQAGPHPVPLERLRPASEPVLQSGVWPELMGTWAARARRAAMEWPWRGDRSDSGSTARGR